MPKRIISVEFDGDEPASGSLLAAMGQAIPSATSIQILPPPVETPEEDALTAAVLSPFLSLPVAKYEYPWDGRLARARVLDFCKSKINATPTTKDIDKECARKAFLLLRDSEPTYTREAWDLPYADVIDGRITIVPRGVKALASGHGIVAISGISSDDKRQLQNHACSLYDRVRKVFPQMPECPYEGEHARDTGATRRNKPAVKTAAATPEDLLYDPTINEFGMEEWEVAALAESDIEASAKKKDDGDQDEEPGQDATDDQGDEKKKKKKKPHPDSMYASIVASGESVVPIGKYKVPVYPPSEWFFPPMNQASGPTPLTITSDGRVYGHGALWDSCHAGYSDACVPVPRSAADYQHFHRGAVRTEDDSLIAVGHLTVGAGHAGPDLNIKAAAEHYDDASTTVAVVAAYEDRWGIYLTGSLVADTTPDKIAALLRSPLSGDWRAKNGNLEMVAMHAVNVPGFPVDRPRVAMAASGETLIIDNCAQCSSDMDMLSTEIDKALAEILEGK